MALDGDEVDDDDVVSLYRCACTQTSMLQPIEMRDEGVRATRFYDDVNLLLAASSALRLATSGPTRFGKPIQSMHTPHTGNYRRQSQASDIRRAGSVAPMDGRAPQQPPRIPLQLYRDSLVSIYRGTSLACLSVDRTHARLRPKWLRCPLK